MLYEKGTGLGSFLEILESIIMRIGSFVSARVHHDGTHQDLE